VGGFTLAAPPRSKLQREGEFIFGFCESEDFYLNFFPVIAHFAPWQRKLDYKSCIKCTWNGELAELETPTWQPNHDFLNKNVAK